MRRAVPRPTAALVALALPACASAGGPGGAPTGGESGGASATVELTRIGSAVQLTEDPERTHECEFIADVPLMSPDASDVSTLRAVRNDAGRLGANLVLLVMRSRTTLDRAEGYLCAD